MNYVILVRNVYGFGITLLSLIFILVWFSIGFILARFKLKLIEVVLYSQLICIVNYILIVVQFVILGGGFSNILGVLTQLYILPTIRLVNFVPSTFGLFTMGTLVMVFVIWLGAYLSRKQKVEYENYYKV